MVTETGNIHVTSARETKFQKSTGDRALHTVDGTFYESELWKVIVREETTFHIENMLKR
jgi:hypothetical protein